MYFFPHFMISSLDFCGTTPPCHPLFSHRLHRRLYNASTLCAINKWRKKNILALSHCKLSIQINGKASPIDRWRKVATKLCIFCTGFFVHSFAIRVSRIIDLAGEEYIYGEVYRVQKCHRISISVSVYANVFFFFCGCVWGEILYADSSRMCIRVPEMTLRLIPVAPIRCGQMCVCVCISNRSEAFMRIS